VFESGNAGSVTVCNGPLRCALRGFDKENLTAFSASITDAKVTEASSDTLSRVARARRVTNFPDNVGRGRNSLLPNVDIN
jgi:hypothetical protein